MKITLIALILICFVFMFPLALAQESSPGTLAPTPSPVEYPLPYPGIMPDNPLYILKNVRDTMLSLLIRNPVRKVEFYQLMTDKHMHMGTILVAEKKFDLAEQTFERGDELIQETKQLIDKLPLDEGDQVAQVRSKFKKSLAKYAQILAESQLALPEAQKATLVPILVRVTDYQAQMELK